MADQTGSRRKPPISPRRVFAVLIGLLLIAVGGFFLWGKPLRPVTQTPVLTIVVRPVVSADGKTAIAVVEGAQPRMPGDLALTIAFDTRSIPSHNLSDHSDWRSNRKLPDHQIKGEVLSEPGHPQLQSDPHRIFAMEHRGAIAAEVERLTGSPLYARATRNLGEWVSIQGGAEWWWGLVIFCVGAFVALGALPLRRYGLWRRNGR